MSQRIGSVAIALVMGLGASYALAKLPPPPPEDPAAAEAKKAKAAEAAEKAKADLTAAEERAVQNYQQNMRKMGKPVPRAVAVAAPPAPPKGGQPAPQAGAQNAPGKK